MILILDFKKFRSDKITTFNSSQPDVFYFGKTKYSSTGKASKDFDYYNYLSSDAKWTWVLLEQIAHNTNHWIILEAFSGWIKSDDICEEHEATMNVLFKPVSV